MSYRFAEYFKPGALHKVGLDYASLAATAIAGAQTRGTHPVSGRVFALPMGVQGAPWLDRRDEQPAAHFAGDAVAGELARDGLEHADDGGRRETERDAAGAQPDEPGLLERAGVVCVRQRGFARLQVEPAALWVLDEPFTAIDRKGVAELEALVLPRYRHTAGTDGMYVFI